MRMPVIRTSFGRLKDGRNVDSLVLRHPESDFAVELLEYGATIRAMRVPFGDGRGIDAVLSYPSLSDYESGNVYLGATIGRCAGRTAVNGHAPLRLTCNEADHHLHGGTTGFSHVLWQTLAIDDGERPRVRLRHRSPAGEDGYPGEIVVDAEFALTGALELAVVLEARSDHDTPLNMTLHPYFNLDGGAASPIDAHELRIDADRILALGDERLPTGETMSVDGTPFDFRVAHAIGAHRYEGHAQLRVSGGYDHYFVLRECAPIAVDVFSPASNLGLQVRTNQRGIQFYSGNQLDRATPIAFTPRAAFCVEPHGFPNAINEPRFPDVTLRAGETYRYEARYAFYRR
jgi:aldose 1-epimerase